MSAIDQGGEGGQDASAPVDYTPTYLRQVLTERLSATHVNIEDLSGGCGSAFHAIIVSPQFSSCRTSLARHRLVNSALKEELKTIHAWTMKLYTPTEWEKVGETQ